MRNLIVAGLVCGLILLVGIPAQATTWSSDAGDFATKFWKEMFKGGGPGQPGNTLMAIGEGFHFDKATLVSTYWDGGQGRWITTYEGGELALNPSGPWNPKGTLRATGITATNSSYLDPDTGVLDFVLTFSGEFDNRPGVFFEVTARYNGVPEVKFDDFGNPVFHTGESFSAEITITP